MELARDFIVSPREMEDGTISWEENQPEIAARLRAGDPDLGWLGDERLSLNANLEFPTVDPQKRGLPRWEVWRRHEEGPPSLVCSYVGQRIDGDQLIRRLALHDSRTRDVAQAMLDARTEYRERVARESRDQFEGSADKLAWALGRDLGMPAQSGRVFALGGD